MNRGHGVEAPQVRSSSTELRLAAGRVLLAIIFAWAALALCVSAAFLWTPRGTFGLTAGYGAIIKAVEPGSPATAAGIVPGDRIDLANTSFSVRPYVVGVTAPVPVGTRVTLRIEHDGTSRDVTLAAVLHEGYGANRISLAFGILSGAVFILTGAALIFFRQSLTTWGFGLFCLLSNPVIPALSRFPSAQAHLAYVVLYDILQNVGVIGLLVFALNFPQRVNRSWRRTLVRLLPALFVVVAGWTLWIDLAICVFGIPVDLPNRLLQVAFGLIDVVAIALITETYLSGPGEDRARLRWVLIGFYVGLVCNFVGNLLLYTANVSLPVWVDNVLVALVVTLPLTVGYAVVRHRVIDIDFFISRAIVYALFTTALVALFAIIDFLFSRLLADFRLSLFIEALATIGAAISINAVHKRMERVVDELLFRGRRIARERLERAARALRGTTSPQAVDETLVDESHGALGLVSTALFRTEGEAAGFRRVAACGWPAGTLDRLSANDRLVLEHRVTRGVVKLENVPWENEKLPKGAARPTVSIPLDYRDQVGGLLLCSGTAHGEQLDPEETGWVESVANTAATVYEELEAERMRERLRTLENDVTVLRARLDEARRDRAQPSSP